MPGSNCQRRVGHESGWDAPTGRDPRGIERSAARIGGSWRSARGLDRGRYLHAVRDLCERFPSEASSLESALDALERDAPPFPSAPSFVHGDFGPANLLWRAGHVVVLDFDKCALGDPACDLGNLFAQLFRTTIKRPEILRDFPSARATVLQSYIRWSPIDSDLDSRIAWYERVTLLRKIHGLLFSKSRDPHPEAVRQRQAEAVQLLRME